jgi:hypothetical protein
MAFLINQTQRRTCLICRVCLRQYRLPTIHLMSLSFGRDIADIVGEGVGVDLPPHPLLLNREHRECSFVFRKVASSNLLLDTHRLAVFGSFLQSAKRCHGLRNRSRQFCPRQNTILLLAAINKARAVSESTSWIDSVAVV